MRTIVIALVVGLIVLSAPFALASPAWVFDAESVVLDGDGDPFYAEGLLVWTFSHRATTIVTLKAVDVPNSTGKAVHWDYENTGVAFELFVPWVGIVQTTDWHETLSASGNATLVIKFKL